MRTWPERCRWRDWFCRPGTRAWPSWLLSRSFPCPTDARDKEVYELFDKYNLRSLAVVDAENCPIGAITVDDIVSRMRAKI